MLPTRRALHRQYTDSTTRQASNDGAESRHSPAPAVRPSRPHPVRRREEEGALRVRTTLAAGTIRTTAVRTPTLKQDPDVKQYAAMTTACTSASLLGRLGAMTPLFYRRQVGLLRGVRSLYCTGCSNPKAGHCGGGLGIRYHMRSLLCPRSHIIVVYNSSGSSPYIKSMVFLYDTCYSLIPHSTGHPLPSPLPSPIFSHTAHSTTIPEEGQISNTGVWLRAPRCYYWHSSVVCAYPRVVSIGRRVCNIMFQATLVLPLRPTLLLQ